MSYQVCPWVNIRRRRDGDVLYVCGSKHGAVISRAQAYKESAKARRMSLLDPWHCLSLTPSLYTPGRLCVDLVWYTNTAYNWRTFHIFFREQSGRCERCLCHLRCCGSQKGKPKALLCRCPPRNSYSPSCTCPAPPLASNLLFVSQEFREESSTTKFGNSEFLVTGNTCEV